MKYPVELLVCVLALVSCGVDGAPDCLDTFTSEQCAEYTKTGGGRIVLSPLTDPDQFDGAVKDMLKVVMANISNQYVISEVEPKDIVVTAVDVSQESNNKVTVHFFVANPTGSLVVPIAFRSRELYLMMTLNQDKIVEMLDYEVIALEPESANKLPLPTWALAIIVYVGLVVVIALIYLGTSDIRRQWSESSEEKLRKAVMGDSDMQIDPESGVAETNGNKPAKMYRDNQTSFGVQVSQQDIAVTLGITYATVEEKSNVTKSPDPDAPPPQEPPEYMEITDAEPAAEATSGDKHEAEATAALEGAINQAYEETPGDTTTSL